MTIADEIILAGNTNQFAAKRWRNGNAKTRILALHGWLDNAGSFDFLAPLIDDAEVIALDFSGHGKSAHHPPGHWYHYIDYLDDLDAALDALNWPNAIMLAHSMGGTIASAYAACKPHRVQALWLIEALGALSSDPEKALDNLRKSMAERERLAEKSLRVFPTIEFAIQARIQANGLSAHAARALVERGTRKVEGGLVWSSDPRLTIGSPWRLTETHILSFLRGIECPTTVILADPAQIYLPRDAMLQRAAQVPQCQLHVIEGSHHLHMETPLAVANIINSKR